MMSSSDESFIKSAHFRKAGVENIKSLLMAQKNRHFDSEISDRRSLIGELCPEASERQEEKSLSRM